MTCEEFRLFIMTHAFDRTSRAERAVCLRHMDQCPTCVQLIRDRVAKKQLKPSMTDAEIGAVWASDIADPEYRETRYGGRKMTEAEAKEITERETGCGKVTYQNMCETIAFVVNHLFPDGNMTGEQVWEQDPDGGVLGIYQEFAICKLLLGVGLESFDPVRGAAPRPMQLPSLFDQIGMGLAESLDAAKAKTQAQGPKDHA